MILTCPDEAFRYIGTAILAALSEPSLGARLAGRPLRLRVGLIDPDCVLFIDANSRELRFGGGDDGDTALIAMKGDSAVRYCQGRLDMETALAGGEVAADGDWRDLLDLLTYEANVRESFAAVVRREGRVDLLAEPVAC